jgi:hypothetical protein
MQESLNEDIRKILSHLDLEVIAFNEEQALKAGMLRPNTNQSGFHLLYSAHR